MEAEKFERLTDEDLDVLSGMMIIFLTSAERIIQMIELAYERQYRESKDYMTYVKLYGKLKTDEIVKQQVQKVVRGDERNKIGKILKAAKDFHYHMESLNKSGREAHRADVTEAENFDAIIHDSNLLCYIYALMGNCPYDDDELKLLSTLKVLAKGNKVSDRIIGRLKQ